MGKLKEFEPTEAQGDGSFKLWPGESQVFVVIAWHYTGWEDDPRMLLDEDGDNVPDLDETVIGAFTDERLARIGAEGYVKDHHGMLDADPDHGGSGRVMCVTLSLAGFNVHGTCPQVGRYDAESGEWEDAARAAQATIPDAEEEP